MGLILSVVKEVRLMIDSVCCFMVIDGVGKRMVVVIFDFVWSGGLFFYEVSDKLYMRLFVIVYIYL